MTKLLHFPKGKSGALSISKRVFALSLVAFATVTQAQDVKTQVIDNAGSGLHRAVMASDKSLPTHTIFKPQDLKNFGPKNPLPVLVWGNGACANTPDEHKNFLNEIASHGYLVVAIGPIPEEGEKRPYEVTPSKLLTEAIDWVYQQNSDKKSQYYKKLDPNNIAVGGMSCGGLQALDIAADPRLKTVMICNSGLFINPVTAMPNMPMPTKDRLKEIHTPIMYMLGGKIDIAYENGMDDFHRINHVPAFACNLEVGHGGTYGDPYGGEFGVIATAWLDWQLKNDPEAEKMFVGKDCGVSKREGWTVEKQNIDGELWIPSGNQLVYGVLSKPENPNNEKQPIAIIAHGFNGSHQYGKAYFEPLNKMGYQCFTLDFPCGSVNSRADNNTLNMSIIDEQQALESVVKYFQEQPDVDPERIILIGESQGGLISALTAANPANNIDRLILVYPALCIPDNWNQRYANIEDIPEETNLWNVKLGRRFFTELRYLRPYDIIGAYEGPVQIIHGDMDQVVPLDYSKRALETYKNANLHVIKGANHGFKPEEFKEEIQVVEEFLNK